MLGTLNPTPTVGAVSLGFNVVTANFTKGLGSTYGLVVDSVGVVGKRKFGWTGATGTAARTTFDTASVTLEELAKRVKALMDDLIAHGLIGN